MLSTSISTDSSYGSNKRFLEYLWLLRDILQLSFNQKGCAPFKIWPFFEMLGTSTDHSVVYRRYTVSWVIPRCRQKGKAGKFGINKLPDDTVFMQSKFNISRRIFPFKSLLQEERRHLERNSVSQSGAVEPLVPQNIL